MAFEIQAKRMAFTPCQTPHRGVARDSSPSSNPVAQSQDSAAKVCQYQIQNNPALTETLRQNEDLLAEQGQKNGLDPALISMAVRHNARGTEIRPTLPQSSSSSSPDQVTSGRETHSCGGIWLTMK